MTKRDRNGINFCFPIATSTISSEFDLKTNSFIAILCVYIDVASYVITALVIMHTPYNVITKGFIIVFPVSKKKEKKKQNHPYKTKF